MTRSPDSPVNPWIIAVAVMLGTFMEVLDTTVVNVSLNHIAGNLSATTDEATWVLTSYLVANAIILPMTGWLANHFGRKRILLLSVSGFTLASMACGVAPSLGSLIFFRVIQGACGGGLQPLSQAIMLEAFPPEKRGRAMAFWALGIVVAPMLGPVLGGWLTDSYSWRWLFYINIPVGLAALVMCVLFIFDPPYIRRASERIDYWGIGLLAVGMGALQIFLDKGQEEDWFSSRFIQVLAVTAAVGLLLFIVNELRSPHPVVNLRVLKIRTFSTGVFLMTVLGFVLYGSTVLIPIWLQTLMGYSALQAGLAMLPRGLGSFLFMPIVGILTTKIEPRKLLSVGLLASSASLFLLGALNLNAGYRDIFWPLILQGTSLGLLFVPLTTVTHDPIPQEQMGNATSIFNLMRNIGGSIGIASMTTLVARNTQRHINILGAHVTPYDTPTRLMFEGLRRAFLAQGSDLATATRRAYAALFAMVRQQAAMLSFMDAFRLLGIFFLLALPLILLMRRPQHRGGPMAAD
ncbi:MAG TPA: DHA2 family efflux MFS transporter permease subunit [Terriglobales bacterium]|jgi:DHA2 family multidrug resistance protein|nr:DHA2 family efflux MFS transporter permease subunit [Terriglobales bacterium]